MKTGAHFVILGGGMTSHAAAMAARGHGFRGRITIVSDERFRPYDRTHLSKSFMQGERDTGGLYFMSGNDYATHDIEFILGNAASSVDFDRRTISLEHGEELAYDQLLIATGCNPIRLRQPGFELDGVHYLRRIPDADAIRSELRQARHAVIIGGSFIGSEAAASARKLGTDVTVVDMLSTPMEAALGPEIGQLCAEVHREQGVTLEMNQRVVELRGTNRVEVAVLDDGREINCDLAIVGVGVRPNTSIFDASNLQIENGIVVDEFCRTSIPDVYAAGDIANWWHPEREERMRVEHFDNAGAQGTFVGKVIAGAQDEPYAPVPYFWSDQYDTNIQFVGFPVDSPEIVMRGDPAEHAVTAFYLHNEEIHAAVTVNRPRELRSARRLVTARASVDADMLRDPQTDLRKLSRDFG